VESHTDLQKGPSVDEAAFKDVCKWASEIVPDAFAMRTWGPRFGQEKAFYVGDIHVAEIEGASGEEVALLQNGSMTPVKLIGLPFVECRSIRPGTLEWAIEVDLTDAWNEPDLLFSFPNEPLVEKVVRRAVMGMRGDVRLSRSGLTLKQDWVSSHFRMSPVRVKDVVSALFQQARLEIEPSAPGRYAEQILRKMGSLRWDCRVFKLRGVRAILDKLGDGVSTLTKGNMHDIVMSQAADEHGVNWRPELYEGLYLEEGQSGPPRFAAVFDVLLASRIIRPGYHLQCTACSKEAWYHVSEFSEEYSCRYCFTSQRVNFASVREWHYKADGLFQIPDSAQGSAAVILSLWRLGNFARMERGRFVTAFTASGRDPDVNVEVDYAFIYIDRFKSDYSLVLGQATRFNDFTDEEVGKMKAVADRFPKKPYLAFSTLLDKLSEAGKERLRNLTKEGYRVLVFTREELDPYELFTRFDGAPHKYAITLDELSQNTLALNLAPAVVVAPGGAAK
jgi:hypothetical protein